MLIITFAVGIIFCYYDRGCDDDFSQSWFGGDGAIIINFNKPSRCWCFAPATIDAADDAVIVVVVVAAAAAAAAAGLYVDHLGNNHTLCPQHSTSNAREVKRVLSMGGTIVNGRVSAVREAGHTAGRLYSLQIVCSRTCMYHLSSIIYSVYRSVGAE